MLNKTLAVVIILFCIACDDNSVNEIRETSEAQGLNRTWKVVKFIDLSNNHSITDTPDNTFELGREIVITFDVSEVPHRFQGANTTNWISGTFEYLYQGQQLVGELAPSDRIEVHEVASTYVAQPEWADLFNLHFDGKMRYEKSGERLTFFNDKSFAIVFESEK